MTGYLRTAGVNARLDTAVAAHGTVAGRRVATRHTWLAGHEGKSAGYVKIGATTAASPPTRWSVLVTGGVHARELAPPDALVSFVEKLLTAYADGTGVSYPAITTDGVTYPAFTVGPDEVISVVERLNLVVAPLVNADGRDFVLAPLPFGTSADDEDLHKLWRKNRRPKPVVFTDERAGGVDVNRNFDILFKFTKHYKVAVADVHTSEDRVRDDYCGTDAESEPETKNLVKLFRDEGVGYYLDVHSFGRTIMYSWGIESNQSDDPAQSFTNPAWDGRRDGTLLPAYREYIPAAHHAASVAIATQMCNDIATRAAGPSAAALRRSTYDPIPSANLYVTSGAADDYCFSRWFTAAQAGRPIRPVVALTMEAGGDVRKGADHQEGEFWPDHTTQFPKIEREIHVAVWSFLTQAAATPVATPGAPPPPAPAPSPTPQPSGPCLVATTLYRDPEHPSVVFLRDVRDRQLPASPAGARFATWLNAAYYRAAPPLAGWFTRHPAAARAARLVVLAPLVHTLRLASAATGRSPRARSLALSAALGAVAGPVIAVVRALDRRGSRGSVAPGGGLEPPTFGTKGRRSAS